MSSVLKGKFEPLENKLHKFGLEYVHILNIYFYIELFESTTLRCNEIYLKNFK
jgi:hypothetical protein